MSYPKITPELIADANIYRYEKKYRDDNLYYIKDINDGEQSLFLREFSGIGDSMKFEFVEMDYDTFMSNDVVKLDRPLKKFKIGDRVEQIKEGKGTNSSDNGKESIVTWVNLNYYGKDGISIDGTGFHYQEIIRGSEAFELVAEPKKEKMKEMTPIFKPGDKVRYARETLPLESRGPRCKWTEMAGLVLGNIYTVHGVGERSISVKEDSIRFGLNKLQFDLVTADTYDATVTTKEVAPSQSKEIDSASPEPEENVLLLMLH